MKVKISNPLNRWREEKPAAHNSRYVGEHAGYDTSILPRLTWKGFWMGILVSMGEDDSDVKMFSG
jgi:SP family sugar:H+ symporter-like MFS transporter